MEVFWKNSLELQSAERIKRDLKHSKRVSFTANCESPKGGLIDGRKNTSEKKTLPKNENGCPFGEKVFPYRNFLKSYSEKS